jgi:hypothetical protein
MEWRTTTVDITNHVFADDLEELWYALEWYIQDKSTGIIVCSLDNARLCIRNDRLITIVRVRADIDLPNEHEILEVVSHITGKNIRSID